ncbi:MAG TPA: DUF1697 domain-containing protein [Gemmatimonadaceae bacterium]|nr:DUF1697 domain-containing protein [Gemmatimonadaceae bacterium]
MTLVAFIRGVNVGGHRRFRPSLLAKELSAYDVVNIGAAGTLVVRKPGSRAKFLAALRARLPFDAEIALCDARALQRLEKANPFGPRASGPDVVRFVSVLTKTGRSRDALAVHLPSKQDWLVRVVGADGRFVFGEYRRHMKTIGYLGKLDSLIGSPVTTRNWNTIRQILAILKGDGD